MRLPQSGRFKQLAMLALLTLCVGPAPGEVGGCGSEATVADARDFCQQRDAWECRRAEFRGEIDDVQACVDLIPDACASANWLFSCEPFPTNRETQGCIDQLALVTNIDKESSEIPECQPCPIPR